MNARLVRASVSGLVVFFYLLVWVGLAGAEALALADRARVGASAEIYEDQTLSMTVAEASSATFQRLDQAQANHGFSRSAFWVRFAIDNLADEPERVIIELSATAWRAELFDREDHALLSRSGAGEPFDVRPVDHANIAFHAVIPARGRRLLLLRIESRDTVIIDPVVWREEAFWRAAVRGRLLDGLYYGIIVGLALYNLFLAFATRHRRAYLAYVVFQLAIAASNAAIDKYTFQFLWPHSPIWAARSEQVFDMLALAAAMECARWLLDTPRLLPRADRALRLAGLVAAAIGIVSIIVETTPTQLFVVAAVFFVGIGLLVVAAALVARTGSPHGRIFLLAWSLLFASTLGAGLAATGVVQSFVGYDLLKVGSAAEALLLSLGLAARFRTIEAERAAAQEALVTERSRRVDALARVVAGVAHEIGNPLNFAKGGAAALSEQLEAEGSPLSTAGSAPTKRAVALVTSGLARIERIVDHLRADLGGRQANATTIDLAMELDVSFEMLGAFLTKRGVVVRRRSPPGIVVRARSGDLTQVFANLARNAGDAMPDGGTLDVTVVVDGESVLVTFQDQGRGVPPELREAVFEPFFTTRAAGAGSTSGANVGTGLGLFVSKTIVERWGGSLVVADDSRRGATFVVRLPLADPDVVV